MDQYACHPIIIELYSSIGNFMHFASPHRNSLNTTISSDRTFRDTPSENADPLLYDPLCNPQGNHAKSRPISKPSIGNPLEHSPQAGRNINTIRNSCFVGNPPFLSQEEAKSGRNIRDGQDQPFLSLSINNSCRYQQNTALLDQLYEERRKSESTFNKSSHPVQATFLKSHGEPIPLPIKQKDPVIPNEGALRDMIEQLARRVTTTQQQISRLKEKTEQDKRSPPDGDLKEFKGKLLQLAKFNSKHFTEYEARLENQSKMMEEIQKKMMSCNGSDYLKKTNILQAKLNELYEGFKIKAGHNRKEISKGLQSLQINMKDYIRVQISNLQQTISDSESKKNASLHSRILEIQAQMKQKTWYNINQLQRSTKKCHHWKTIQSKETLIIKKDPSRDKPKSKFVNTPRNWVYQTPTKENIDTPIKGLNFQEPKEATIREQTYYVDPQGYLLDENKYYLLNSQDQQILLPPSMLAYLKQNDMLRA